tara:strand:- start:883 stop:1248 length:366 start_codon:yes stop_codon:yes gene_type:complete
MPIQSRAERSAANAKSAAENKVKRAERNKAKASRREMREALQGATSAGERREIKEQFAEPYKTPKPETATEDLVGYNGTVSSTGGDTGGSGGDTGGGTFELDVVKDDNTAGRASFTGDGII